MLLHEGAASAQADGPIRQARPPIATLRGELDIAIAPALRERLLSLARPGTIRLVVALTAVSYVDAPRLTAIETPAEEVTLTSITALSPDRESMRCRLHTTPLDVPDGCRALVLGRQDGGGLCCHRISRRRGTRPR